MPSQRGLCMEEEEVVLTEPDDPENPPWLNEQLRTQQLRTAGVVGVVGENFAKSKQPKGRQRRTRCMS